SDATLSLPPATEPDQRALAGFAHGGDHLRIRRTLVVAAGGGLHAAERAVHDDRPGVVFVGLEVEMRRALGEERLRHAQRQRRTDAATTHLIGNREHREIPAVWVERVDRHPTRL